MSLADDQTIIETLGAKALQRSERALRRRKRAAGTDAERVDAARGARLDVEEAAVRRAGRVDRAAACRGHARRAQPASSSSRTAPIGRVGRWCVV